MIVVKQSSISDAWREAMTLVSARGVSSITPLAVNISGFDAGVAQENLAVRKVVNDELRRRGAKYVAVETTANLIFPQSIWRLHAKSGASTFFDRYAKQVAPRLRKADARNRKGTYFERLVNYGGLNQLEHILATWNGGNHRTSALQAIIFDPREDHTKQPFLPFPCLDYVAFAPDDAGGLSVVAFYAQQYIFDRAYGNYLGLCRLGAFMAEQMKLQLNQVTCIAGSAKMGDEITKTEAKALLQNVTEAQQGTSVAASMSHASGPSV